MKSYQLVFATLFIFCCVTFNNAQTIQCSFPSLANQKVKFGVFNGLQSKTIDSVLVGSNGNFSFHFPTDKPGIGYLITEENKPYFLILDKGEQIKLKGDYLSMPETIKVLSGKQNQAFSQYASEHPKREQTLSAWHYLEQIYTLDSLFFTDKKTKKMIMQQFAKIKKQDQDFLNHLDSKSYVAWYLPIRKLVSDVSIVAQYRTEEIPATIQAFKKLDYTDERLYRSGLLRDAVESHFWLLENSGKSLDSVFIDMKISIDSMVIKLVKDEKKLNEITDYLFDLLERHSLFQASEYLALKMLNQVSCTIDNNLAKQLETYRVMKKGNIAPDFSFYPNTIFPDEISKEKTMKLSDLKSPYTLIVFGASTCPKCAEEIPQIAEKYAKWKAEGIEVVFISLDEKVYDFQQFSKSFPFISSCDYLNWNSPIVESYYVFATPTMFLLDKKRKILQRPNSVEQIDAWVDWFLINENH
jgi:thiol-disulfide isomerase/thioredoxin